jgi:hypothetical protein
MKTPLKDKGCDNVLPGQGYQMTEEVVMDGYREWPNDNYQG